MRKWLSFSTGSHAQEFEQKLYRMVNEFRYAVVLTDKYPFYNGHAQQYREFDLLAGFDALEVVNDNFSHLDRVVSDSNDWFLGYFSFDFKNQLEPFLTTSKKDKTGFRPFSFFRPRYLIRKNGETWHIGYDSRRDTKDTSQVFIDKIKNLFSEETDLPDIEFQSRVSRSGYLDTVRKLKDHIKRGDIYEVNYCMEFYSEGIDLQPSSLFKELTVVSPMPFSVLLRDNSSFLIGASPERYLRKRGARVISQPMKGTARRTFDGTDDIRAMKMLSESEKERAENIMITDLVRNDLSRSAARGTVSVDDLCSIFPFPGVYQMISTVSSQMHNDAHWIDPLRYSFPMGSMTGAPKIRALQLIDRYEKSARGLYSGTVGYITPELDFDFNVVIRSFLYNRANQYLSYSVGSAITDSCIPAEEYNECLLKAEALKTIFNKKKLQYG
ncbi:MAG: para-aminobenzoate synthetase component [Anaerophaga sp.]|jgi:para-aminobenzoate synthetase component 1|nr:para-aminobenzoate synthetase component [Anaerophaga sp.]